MALKIEGMPRHASTHAAGVVITREAANEYVPLASNDGVPVTQFTMTTIEELGLLKMDFLGLRTLTVLQERRGDDAPPRARTSRWTTSPHDDAAVYDMLGPSETEGVFQLETTGMRQVLAGLQADQNLEDIIAAHLPLSPRAHGFHPHLHAQPPRAGQGALQDSPAGPHSGRDQRLYRLSGAGDADLPGAGGLLVGQADLVRRAMSKKKHDVMEQERANFIYGSTDRDGCPGCVANGIPREAANDIFDDMSSFASYAFNKSHAAAMRYVAYQTAYLKCHYPSEFMAALLTSVLDNTDKVIEYTGECQRLGIKVLPPRHQRERRRLHRGRQETSALA